LQFQFGKSFLMNHRRGYSPKHYKGVLSYKEAP
jgi:hypothetical protein